MTPAKMPTVSACDIESRMYDPMPFVSCDELADDGGTHGAWCGDLHAGQKERNDARNVDLAQKRAG